MPGNHSDIQNYEAAMHRVGQLEEAYEVAMHRIGQLEAELAKPAELPIVVAEFDCGVLLDVTSTQPLQFIWLDKDTEGADEDQVISLFGEEYYRSLTVTGQEAESIDPEYCASVLEGLGL